MSFICSMTMVGSTKGVRSPISVGWADFPKAADTLHDVGLRSQRLLRCPDPQVDAPLSMIFCGKIS